MAAGEAGRRGRDGGGGPLTFEGHCELISTPQRRGRADEEEGGEVRKRRARQKIEEEEEARCHGQALRAKGGREGVLGDRGAEGVKTHLLLEGVRWFFFWRQSDGGTDAASAAVGAWTGRQQRLG